EHQTIEFLEAYVPAGASPMCGNSICQDRRFMARCMPTLEAFFHYRNLDVSTIKELIKRWAPNSLNGFKKGGTHLALDDTRDSIRELRFYREHFFKY
ncbi:MAG TPA: oligoribonuclease, partial [Gammaproteobacteria bacterium]|nr:oligoribonuclease [Gammaproteobacteria bacterium]